MELFAPLLGTSCFMEVTAGTVGESTLGKSNHGEEGETKHSPRKRNSGTPIGNVHNRRAVVST
jgi:hypothetical protein